MSEKVPVRPDSLPESRLRPEMVNRVALTLIVLATLPMLTKIFTSDFGTHLAIGREILQSMKLPSQEFLNYPSLGMENPNGEWLFQAVLYGVFSVGGEYGVSMLCWAVVLGVYLLLYRCLILRGAHPLISVLAIFAFSGFLRIRIQPRPEIFTYLFVSLTLYLLTEYFFGKRKRILFLFPAILLIWANMHPSYLIGFVLFGLYFTDALARAAWNRQFQWASIRMWIFPPLVAGLLGLLLSGLNPNGYHAILVPLHLISRGEGAGGGLHGGAHSILSFISELTPVRQTGMYVYFKIAVAVSLLSLLLGAVGRRVYLLDLLLFAMAFKGSWDSSRAVSMMGLFLSPGIAVQLTGFLDRTARWVGTDMGAKTAAPVNPPPRRKKAARSGKPAAQETRKQAGTVRPGRLPLLQKGAVAVLSLGLLLLGTNKLVFSFSQLEWGVGVTEHKFSFAAGEFLRANPVPGNMFNFFDIGGFLDWQVYPQKRTFIDGRTYNQKVFMEHQVIIGGFSGWKELVDKYGITFMVLKSMDSSGMIAPIVPTLANDKEWSLVFADGLFLIFVRNTPETRTYIREHEISKDLIPRHIIWEGYHYLYLGVSPVVVYQTTSNMYELMGDRLAAIQAIRKALEYADLPPLRARLNQLERGVRGSAPIGATGN